MTDPRATPDLLVVSHSGARAGAPMVLLRFLRWLRQETALDVDVVLLHGGSMEHDFAEFGATILGGSGSRLWMLQRGLTNVGLPRAAGALAAARLGPTMWRKHRAPLILLNSVGSLPALRFMPETTTGTVVVYVHELDHGFERTIPAPVWDRLAPRVDHFIGCSEPVREMLVERKGIDVRRVTVHPGFVDVEHVEPSSSRRLRRELGIPAGALVVGASGRPDWRKAPEVFVRLARVVCDQRPDLDVHFIWLGGPMEGSVRWQLAHDIERAGLEGRVHLVGESLRPAEIMALFDLFALTSREDPFPLAMLEAASLGVPVVSFANGGVVQFAHQGSGGVLAEVVPYLDVVSMAASIQRLLDDPVERKALGLRGQQHVLAHHRTDQGALRLFEALVKLQPQLGSRWEGPT